MHRSNLSPVRVLGALLGLALALAATVAQAHDIIVCKSTISSLPERVQAGRPFIFALDDLPTFVLTVGGTCMQFASVGVGDHIITEGASSNTSVLMVDVSPSDRLVSVDLADRTVTVEAVDAPPPPRSRSSTSAHVRRRAAGIGLDVA